MPRIMTMLLISCLATAGLLGGCRKSARPRPPVTSQPSTVPATMPATAPAATSAAVSAFPSQNSGVDAAHLAMAQQDINAGLDYFLRNQNADGGWGKPVSMPAFTGLVLKALVRHPDFGLDAPPVQRGLSSLLLSVQEDGGIYNPKIGQANYTTSVAAMALAACIERGGDGAEKLKPVLQNALRYLKGLQIVAGSVTPKGITVTPANPYFGGMSYGEHGRPDLSNLQFTMDALHEGGVPADDPFFARAVAFLSRVQNRSESNDQPWAAVVNDGGFVYAPGSSADGMDAESKADEVTIDGQRGLRSYGSMTYAGFKSLLYANVGRNDARVQAALEWIRQYWRLDSNPNMPEARSRQGLYYYYQVFAKALRAWGEQSITDKRGVGHNWRQELIEVLHEQRHADGSWVNSEPRWYENMPDLVTAYSVLALEETLEK